MPDSPVVGTSSRRNCPCCEETMNYADLDPPTPAELVNTQIIGPEQTGFRVLFKSYSVGNVVRVVRRKPITPFSLQQNVQKSKRHDSLMITRSNFAKKLSIAINSIAKNSYAIKNLAANPLKEGRLNIIEENVNFTRERLGVMWRNQERKMKQFGGLTTVQKVLKRSNLPPLASSINSLRFRASGKQ